MILDEQSSDTRPPQGFWQKLNAGFDNTTGGRNVGSVFGLILLIVWLADLVSPKRRRNG
ncbi:MAG: hypothetical protein JWP35_895 [Caulobacter sp.]|nr:hypothetical protein [Caulobacter sp.]